MLYRALGYWVSRKSYQTIFLLFNSYRCQILENLCLKSLYTQSNKTSQWPNFILIVSAIFDRKYFIENPTEKIRFFLFTPFNRFRKNSLWAIHGLCYGVYWRLQISRKSDQNMCFHFLPLLWTNNNNNMKIANSVPMSNAPRQIANVKDLDLAQKWSRFFEATR